MKSIVDILLERVKENPHGKILNFLDYSTDKAAVTEVTLQTVLKNALAITRALQEKGARKGDRVVIFSLQDPGTIYAVYGAIMAGTIFTIIPPPIDEGKTERFVSVVKSCKPRFIISNYALEQEAAREEKATGGKERSVCPTGQTTAGKGAAPGPPPSEAVYGLDWYSTIGRFATGGAEQGRGMRCCIWRAGRGDLSAIHVGFHERAQRRAGYP